jgi:hypothetical protein
VARADSTLVAHARWVRAEVRRANRGMVAFTDPLWLGTPDVTAGQAFATLTAYLALAAAASLVFSRRDVTTA